MPEHSRSVARPGPFGNPFKGPDAVDLFRDYLHRHPELVECVRRELRGVNLGCWCKPASRCHADVLLEVANAPSEEEVRSL
jgi:hypothetical protein